MVSPSVLPTKFEKFRRADSVPRETIFQQLLGRFRALIKPFVHDPFHDWRIYVLTVSINSMNLSISHLAHPLATLRIRAANEKSPRGRHYAAYLLWEAGLRLLAAVLLVEFQNQARQCPNLNQPLDGLKRPSTGHWRAIVRELLPVISEQDPGLCAVADRLGAKRVVRDMPAAAALAHAIERELRPQKDSQLQSTVRLSKLFDDIVSYRTDIRGYSGARRAWR